MTKRAKAKSINKTYKICYFKRMLGAPADVKELEYISALHQTCVPDTRENGTVSSLDIQALLASRYGLFLSHAECIEIIRGLGGGMSQDEIEFTRSLDMGYESQHYHIETPVPDGKLTKNSKVKISNSFELLHETKYGHRIAAPMTTANVRLKATGRIKDVPVAEIKQGKEVPQSALKPKYMSKI